MYQKLLTAYRSGGKYFLIALPVVFAAGVLSSTQVINFAGYVSRQTVENVPFLANSRDEELISKFDKTNWAEEQSLSREFIHGMQASPRFRKHVLRVFLASPYTLEVRRFALQLLLENSNPEQIALAKNLADHSKNPTEKAGGIALLSASPDPSSTLDYYRELFFREKVPEVLIELTQAMSMPEVPDPQLSQRMINRLHELTTQPEPALRMVSVQKLAQWDVEGNVFRNDAIRLLSDVDKEVRIATIGATSIATAQLDNAIKDQLLYIMRNEKLETVERSIAKQNLIKHKLNEDEYKLYKMFNLQ